MISVKITAKQSELPIQIQSLPVIGPVKSVVGKVIDANGLEIDYDLEITQDVPSAGGK